MLQFEHMAVPLDFGDKSIGQLIFAPRDLKPTASIIAGSKAPIKHFGTKDSSFDSHEDGCQFDAMKMSSLSGLLVFVDNVRLLDVLKSIIYDIEDNLQTYHSVDTYSSFTSLDLISAIDALETVMHLNQTHQMFLKVNRLKRRLSEWAPPSYLIINSLYKYLNSSKDYSHESNLLNRLKKIISKYEGFRNSIVQSNLGLVYSVANKFRYLGLPYEDLVQEGNLGLIKAVERFDLSKGFKFSTYAHIVISQSIHLAIDKQASLVRMPFKALREKASVEKIRQSIEQALGRVPTISELESALPDDLEYKQVHISNAIEPSASSQSLYASPGDSELLEEMSPLEQDAKTASLSHLDIIDNALARLSDRESYILRMRYGIGLNKEYTLEEISQTVGLSRERVRQLSHNAIDKLSRSFDSSSVK